MTYELLKNKMSNGTEFTKADAQRWIDHLPLSTTPEQVKELEALRDKRGLDFLPEDGESRLQAVEQSTEELTLMMADMMGGAM